MNNSIPYQLIDIKHSVIDNQDWTKIKRIYELGELIHQITLFDEKGLATNSANLLPNESYSLLGSDCSVRNFFLVNVNMNVHVNPKKSNKLLIQYPDSKKIFTPIPAIFSFPGFGKELAYKPIPFPKIQKYDSKIYKNTFLSSLAKNYDGIKAETFGHLFELSELTESIENNESVELSDIFYDEFVHQLSLVSPKKWEGTDRADKNAKSILTFKQLRKNSVVVDFGAGDAEILSSLSRIVGLKRENAIAIDLKEPPQSKYYVSRENFDGMADSSVDCVLLLEVFHHIHPKHRSGIAREIVRVLKDDGVLIVKEHDFIRDEDWLKMMLAIHEMWYFYKSESRDEMYPIYNSNDSIASLFLPLKVTKYESWEHKNYQRVYTMGLSKNPVVKKSGMYKIIDGKPVFVEIN